MANTVKFTNNAPKINFTRAFRQQIYTLDLAAVLLIHINQNQLSDKQPIKQAENASIEAFKAINPFFPNIPISSKDEKRFRRQETKIKNILSECRVDDKSITPDIINAILLLMEKAATSAQKGNHKTLVAAWDNLLKNLIEVFEQIDPDLSNEKWGQLGLKLAEDIEKAMEI